MPSRHSSVLVGGDRPPHDTSPVVLDAVAAAKEHHNLLVKVLFQEGEQQQQALVSRRHHIALLKALACGCGPAVINTHIQRLVLEAQASKVLNL